MRLFAATLLASTIIELLGGSESWARKTTSRPNVIIMVADDLGYADLAFLDHSSADVKKLGTPNLDRIAAMGTYFASTLIDFENGQPLEIESMFHVPLRQAQAIGVPVPRLEALCIVLGKLAGYLPRP